MADEKRVFDEIANSLVAEEANSYLDERLAQVERWAAHQERHGQPADLRSLINQLMQEPNDRGPVIVTVATALWRLREMEKANAHKP